jgi:hypothetical protein
MEAIALHVYPHRSTVEPRTLGLEGESYEAFQPPLYYLLAAPVFLIASNYRDKIIAVRLFDVVLVLAAAAILALLARAVVAEHWRLAYAAGLSVLLWPGVVVRAVTVSNAALELPLTLLYILVLWHATRTRSPRLLLAAGALLGLCLLSGLTLIFLALGLALPIVALLRERRDARALATVALAGALPLLLLAPWIISNEARYGVLFAGSLAKQIQTPLVNPTGKTFGIAAVFARLYRLDRALLPQEWWPEYGTGGLNIVLWLAPALVVGRARAAGDPPAPRAHARRGAAHRAATARRADAGGDRRLRRLAELHAPLRQPDDAAARAVRRLGLARAARRRPAVAAGLVGAATALTAFVWIYMAGAYYFTHVGASLRIHAAS